LGLFEILTFEDESLRKTAKPVPRVNATVRKTLDDMLATMRSASGVGLAAPQVGISKRMVVVDVGEGPYFLVNPEIVSRSEETESTWEGCLSWPGYVGDVIRPLRVTVKALDRDGHDTWVEGEGFFARALCHEIDHLDGVLFIDRASTIAEVPKSEEPVEVGSEEEADITAVFMGSPDFAVPSLLEMVQSGVKVSLVVTQPDKPAGRKQVLTPTPVRAQAEALGIPVLACKKVSDPEAVKRITDLRPDFIVVAAFGQRLPAPLLGAAKYACLNVHPSLLPLYRGGNPIQRAVMNGDGFSGVSIMYMSDKMDAGDIAIQKTVEVGPDETYGTLESRLAVLGAHALLEAMMLVRAGSAPRVAQDESKTTKAPHLRNGEETIDWAWSSRRIHALVRGLSPRPGAVTWFGEQRMKVWETRILPSERASSDTGSVRRTEGDMAVVATGDGAIGVLEVQPDGRKPMTAQAFLSGRQGASEGFRIQGREA
jgi:methionyl-tRNA formyltransferase